ncbi:MAG: YeeE/YedE family protein [Methylobacter sp.]
MQILIAFISGLVFGVGLILSGMTNPAKVIGFLDLAGAWDMSLAFVMGGAILVGLIAFHIAATRTKALLGDVMRLPTATRIDRRLIGGALVFGVGWGLAGYCPGPAFTSLLSGSGKPVIFVAAMLAGMAIFEIQDRLASRKTGNKCKGYNIEMDEANKQTPST